MTADVAVWISRTSLIELAILISLTPNLTLAFFFMGKNSDKKSVSYSGAFPSRLRLMIDSALYED